MVSSRSEFVSSGRDLENTIFHLVHATALCSYRLGTWRRTRMKAINRVYQLGT
jgi:hypothetical protein